MMRLIDLFGAVIDGGGLSATPIGWIDDSHYIARASSGQLSVFRVDVSAPQTTVAWVAAIPASGFFGGIVPGGI